MTTLTICGLCQREVYSTSKHHLIPKSRHKNKLNKRNFSREEVHTRLVNLCQPCHSSIHSLIPIKKLEYDYNTVAKLLSHPDIQKYLSWIANKPPGIKVRWQSKKNK